MWLTTIISNIALASLLALAACVMQRWLRLAAFARILWVLALVKLVTPPLVNVPLVELPGTLVCTLGACNCGPHATQAIMLNTLGWILLAAWSAGAVATGWTAWRRWAHFRRLMAHARPASPEWQSLAARLSSELSIRRPPEILAVPGRLPPLVVPGRRRPSILLPMALMDRLNPSQRAALLLHELVHVKRRDHLVRLLELMVSVAYWWFPIARLIGRELRACEEACCDAAVVDHLPGARREYARLLLDVFDFANPVPRKVLPQATAMSTADNLEQRLRAILDASKAARCRWPAGAATLALAFAILPCQLQYGFGGRPTPATTSAEHRPTAEATRLPSNPNGDQLAEFCCPS